MKNYLIILIFSLIVLNSCSGPPPAASTTKQCTVTVPQGFFGTLDKFFQLNEDGTNGRSRSTKIMISVDKYNGNGQIETNYKTYIYFGNTGRYNDFLNNIDNCTFTGIEVPTSGTCGITITVDTMECFDNINGNSCNFNQGMATYRGLSTLYPNGSTPDYIYITPNLVSVY